MQVELLQVVNTLLSFLVPRPFLGFIRNCNLIRAKVPILKFRDQLSGIECDLNVNNVVGIYNTHLLAMYTRSEIISIFLCVLNPHLPSSLVIGCSLARPRSPLVYFWTNHACVGVGLRFSRFNRKKVSLRCISVTLLRSTSVVLSDCIKCFPLGTILSSTVTFGITAFWVLFFTKLLLYHWRVYLAFLNHTVGCRPPFYASFNGPNIASPNSVNANCGLFLSLFVQLQADLRTMANCIAFVLSYKVTIRLCSVLRGVHTTD